METRMRSYYFYAYIWDMKTKVNLSIDEELLERAKQYAAKENTSLSELLGKYLQKITQSRKQKKSIIDVVENIKVPKIPINIDFKKEYHEEIEKKHGV